MIEHILTVFSHMSQYKPFFGRYPVNIGIGLLAVIFLLWAPFLANSRNALSVPRKILFGSGLLLLYLFWSLALPVYQVPDEQSHFAYVYHLAEFGKLPIAKFGARDGSYPFIPAEYDRSLDFHQIIFDVNAKHEFSGDTRGIGEGRYSQPPAARAAGHPASPGEWWKVQSNHYPPLYYLLGAGAYSIAGNADLFTRFWAVRLGSIAWSLIAVILAYRISRYVFPAPDDRPLRRAAVLVFALFPMYCQVSVSVNPNILEIVLYEAFILAVLRAVQSPLSARHVMILTAVVSAGMLTKQQFIGLLPVTAILIIVQARKTHCTALRQAGYISLLGIGSFFLAGWWYVWFYLKHGNVDLLALVSPMSRAAAAALQPIPFRDIIASLPEQIPLFLNNFWGNYAWQNIPVPPLLAYAFSGIVIAGLCSAGIKQLNKEYYRKEIVILGGLAGTYVLLLCLAFITIGIQRRIACHVSEEWYLIPLKAFLLMFSKDFQGRYFYPILSVIAVLTLYGLRPEKRRQLPPFTYPVLLSAMAVFNVYSLYIIMSRFY